MKLILIYRRYFLDEVMKEVRNHDPTGRAYYDKVCTRMGLVPVSYLKRHITDPEIVMRYHGLGASAAKAIALVLRVRRSLYLN